MGAVCLIGILDLTLTTTIGHSCCPKIYNCIDPLLENSDKSTLHPCYIVVDESNHS